MGTRNIFCFFLGGGGGGGGVGGGGLFGEIEKIIPELSSNNPP